MENHPIMFVVLAVVWLFKGVILLVKLVYFIIMISFVLIKKLFSKKNKNRIELNSNVNR
ncbi:hypothetical protein [Clostridium estertheticum]|uniref:hypothetical protein n=1 Tax=Clostridium estertheticum TaxID=238834 RepID=UPI001CF4FA64|nr:hypothetical protein [Clostridium estertheticum]MCB2354465.1 hypothetical protein [Clostridium estertheticum]WAG42422.1 hypothetical protein LL065_07020 [Clostridium estertheticum]